MPGPFVEWSFGQPSSPSKAKLGTSLLWQSPKSLSVCLGFLLEPCSLHGQLGFDLVGRGWRGRPWFAGWGLLEGFSEIGFACVLSASFQSSCPCAEGTRVIIPSGCGAGFEFA